MGRTFKCMDEETLGELADTILDEMYENDEDITKWTLFFKNPSNCLAFILNVNKNQIGNQCIGKKR